MCKYLAAIPQGEGKYYEEAAPQKNITTYFANVKSLQSVLGQGGVPRSREDYDADEVDCVATFATLVKYKMFLFFH